MIWASNYYWCFKQNHWLKFVDLSMQRFYRPNSRWCLDRFIDQLIDGSMNNLFCSNRISERYWIGSGVGRLRGSSLPMRQDTQVNTSMETLFLDEGSPNFSRAIYSSLQPTCWISNLWNRGGSMRKDIINTSTEHTLFTTTPSQVPILPAVTHPRSWPLDRRWVCYCRRQIWSRFNRTLTSGEAQRQSPCQ